MSEHTQLFGSCFCERNQYRVVVPTSQASAAQVFFDNGAVSRVAQATPIAAWLRVPLDWYESMTVAHFPDESHSSIKRTFQTPGHADPQRPVRRQFCGYCGTHLTAWDEARDADSVDVTLGSLFSQSLDQLRKLHLYPDWEDDSDASSAEEGGQADRNTEMEVDVAESKQPRARHLLQGDGMPYFENLVQDSRLGRIKRQTGSQSLPDGRVVQWSFVEIGSDVEVESETTHKRLRMA
ncbi:hypothetical protein K470DRAFT_252060 [Piedraia hortae CBS 480.64]|uniref:CENP-V/GFA domain-containing protein n=1 Tax=Piedraia hortae CBS 480.64 TaxID=1314780 RepID=A0A6A7BSA5_9PEZI|nr:hypothetical protein K470DRAFT_252060 [Piedraia hortae CBS 480.64]